MVISGSQTPPSTAPDNQRKRDTNDGISTPLSSPPCVSTPHRHPVPGSNLANAMAKLERLEGRTKKMEATAAKYKAMESEAAGLFLPVEGFERGYVGEAQGHVEVNARLGSKERESEQVRFVPIDSLPIRNVDEAVIKRQKQNVSGDIVMVDTLECSLQHTDGPNADSEQVVTRDAKLNRMLEMGFDEASAIKALQQTGGDEQAAMELLLGA